MSRALAKPLKFSEIESLYAKAKPYYATEKLKRRCAEVGVDPPTFWPIDNQVVCWRFADITISRGGLVIPAGAETPNVKGILMACGPRARDVLYSNGIEEGDIVIWARFSGWELHDKTPTAETKGEEFIVLKDRDILGSDDLRAELAAGKAKYVLDPATGRHNLVRNLLGGKKAKLLALAASTSSPAEADTARRIAAGMKG
jgi:co-chaperonin GroES (HSP10)